MGGKEREKYENASTKSNNRDEPPMKYTTNGISFEEIDRRKAENQKQMKMMELTIEEMLQTAEEQNRKLR